MRIEIKAADYVDGWAYVFEGEKDQYYLVRPPYGVSDLEVVAPGDWEFAVWEHGFQRVLGVTYPRWEDLFNFLDGQLIYCREEGGLSVPGYGDVAESIRQASRDEVKYYLNGVKTGLRFRKVDGAISLLQILSQVPAVAEDPELKHCVDAELANCRKIVFTRNLVRKGGSALFPQAGA